MSRFRTSLRPNGRTPFGSLRVLVGALAGVTFGIALVGRVALAGVDASDTALAKESAGDVAVRLSPDGTAVDFAGPIVVGAADRVRAVLDEHPEVTALRLTSPGGRVVEARDIGALVAERHLVTVAVGSCSSACTIVFMAGRDRLLAPASTLGFHRYHSPDPAQEEAEMNMAIDRRYFSRRGLPDWFIDQAFSTPNRTMWRPSIDQMTAASVITGRVDSRGRRLLAGVIDVPATADSAVPGDAAR